MAAGVLEAGATAAGGSGAAAAAQRSPRERLARLAEAEEQLVRALEQAGAAAALLADGKLASIEAAVSGIGLDLLTTVTVRSVACARVIHHSPNTQALSSYHAHTRHRGRHADGAHHAAGRDY